MQNNHILEDYMKAYRDYLLQEAEKARGLKILDDSGKVKSGSIEKTGLNLNLSENQTVLFITQGINWFIKQMNQLSHPKQPCETC
jgi:hypothetical protein